MKRFYLLLAWIAYFLPGMAQEQNLETRLLETMDMLSYDSLVTGIHSDRSPQYLPLKVFDGTLPSDSVEVSWQHLQMLYGMLAWSQVNGGPLPPLDSTLLARWQEQEDRDTLTIGGLWMRYDRFKSWALDSNLLSWDGQYFLEVPGAASPFEQDVLFAVSFAGDVRYGLTQTLEVSPDWFFTNQPGGWGALELDAGDGLGWRTLNPGDILTIHFPQEGLYYLDFRMITAGGDTLICSNSLEIRAPEQFDGYLTRGFADDPDEILHLGGMSTWKVWTSFTNKCGKEAWRLDDRTLPAGLTATIFYNKECENPGLRKPLFIINGFDPGRSYSWEFVMGLEGILTDPYSDPTGKILSEHLHEERYDIIYVTFSDATGDIITNAGWLRQLIIQVNEMKAATGSKEKNVIIGASMGGLVSKWALLEMQKDTVDHETELLLTLDSPLRGAHIPLGMQAMVKDLSQTKVLGQPLRDIHPSLKYNLETLQSPGARQMLYYNYMTVDSRATSGPSLSVEHDAFMSAFNALGKLAVPHIAISNGSLVGTGNNIVPGEKLLDDYNFGSALGQLLCGKGDWVPTSIAVQSVGINLTVYASPGYTGIVNPLEGKRSNVHFTKLMHQSVLNIVIPSWETYTVSNIQALDHVPGGLRAFNGTDANGNEVKDMPWARKSFCFIPTVSALDLDTEDPFYQGKNISNIKQTVESGITPLRSYVGATSASMQNWEYQVNQEHVTLDRRIANFIKSNLKTKRLRASDSPLTEYTYNYGYLHPKFVNVEVDDPLRTTKFIDFNLHVAQQGKVWIHRDDRIDFTHIKNNPFNTNEELFDVHVVPDFCDQSDVTVSLELGGEIRIGSRMDPFTGQLYFHPNTYLHVMKGGRVLLDEGYHNNLSLIGGHMTIFDGGFVEARWGSRILIDEGSSLTVKTGATLRISDYSSLEVLKGGKLILEPGAIIQLWDGHTPNGRATIHIRGGGELEWQGKIDFSGNGFFQWDTKHIFTLLGDFEMQGMGKDFRFMRLNDNAQLNIIGQNITLRDGLVAYRNGSSIQQEKAALDVRDMSFIGEGNYGAFALSLIQSDRIWVESCAFVDLDRAIDSEAFNGGNEPVYVSNSTFYNCTNGLSVSNASQVLVRQSTFTDNGTALNFIDVQFANILQSEIVNTDQYGVMIGALLENNPIFRMHGCTIDNCTYGIMIPAAGHSGSNNLYNKSNVFLYGGTTIKNSEYGIYLEKGGVDPQGVDYGLVLLDCASLINNHFGVYGSDILLEIDAETHAKSHMFQTVTPNYFQNGPKPYGSNGVHGDRIFEICYVNRKAEPIMARRNRWYNNTPQPGLDMEFHDVNSKGFHCNSYHNMVQLMQFQPVAMEMVTCQVSPREGGWMLPDWEPLPVYNKTEICKISREDSAPLEAHHANTLGMARFYAEDLEEAAAWFEPVAAITDEVRNSLSAPCRQYIDVARVMADALQPLVIPQADLQAPEMKEAVQRLAETSEVSLRVFPNPASDQLEIVLPGQQGQIRLVSSLGMILWQGNFRDHLQIPVHHLADGLYAVQLVDEAGTLLQQQRVMILH